MGEIERGGKWYLYEVFFIFGLKEEVIFNFGKFTRGWLFYWV